MRSETVAGRYSMIRILRGHSKGTPTVKLNLRPSIVFLALLIALAATGALAGVPLVTSYQGRLLDASDQPVNGTFNMVFQIYDVPTGGTPLWTEDKVGVQVTDGLFTVALGSSVPLSADLLAGSGGGGGGAVRYLQIQIAGQPPISPRTRLAAAPYAVASGSVSGDIQTSPGRVVAGDLDGDGFLDISSSTDQSELHLARKRPGRVKYSNLILRVMPDSLTDYRDTDSDDDGVPETAFLQRLTPTTSSLAINSKGTSAKREIKASTDSDSATILMTDDVDGDGVPESSVSQSSNSNGAEVSLRTRIDSTPARISTNFTVSKQSQGVDFGQRYDSDGDGTPETSMSATVQRKSGSIVYLDREGNEVLRSMVGVDSTKGVISTDHDSDDDGSPEDEAMLKVLPGTSSVAIKTKGTGADPNRVVITTTPDSVVSDLTYEFTNSLLMPALMKAKEKANRTKCSNNLRYQSPVATNEAELAVDSAGSGLTMTADSDGDGVPEAKMSGKIINGQFTGGPGTINLQLADADDDGVPESEISQTVLPTTSSVAIKTKGTGADKDRVISITTDTSKAVTVHSADVDGDGLADRVIREQCDDDDASITVARGTSEIKIKHKGWDGTIKGRMAIENGGAIQVDFAGDGVGFVSQRFGVGVLSPTHPIEHSSGAHLTAGGVWTNASDENLKENFQPVDGAELLEKIEQLPISEWNYKTESDEVTHIGPTAQDFKETFGVGSDGKSISTIDPSGIALAAIKELNKQNRELKSENENLKKQLEALARKVENLAAGK